MHFYIISEHRGRRIESKAGVIADSGPEEALRDCSLKSMPPEVRKYWQFIDDTLGGGALVDPRDEYHCFRADPRVERDDCTEEEESWSEGD